MKLKNWNKLGFLFVLALLIMFHSSCGWKTTEFTLTVVVGEGISGVPESGTYVYQEFEEIEYKYEAEGDIIQPEIYVNNYRKLILEGTLVMYCDTILTVEQIDIRKEWNMIFSEQDIDDVEWEITFSGPDLRFGTFSDNRGYTGIWEVSGDNDLTIRYDDWADYVFTGTLSALGGNWEGEGKSGSWYIYLDS
ncbi:MAG: hypothetical protein KAS65_11470 [Candidatus Aminicenantes bacterium]|nr:hypothetical protein [Candidatus Aminicenantes bacterium]